MRKLQKKQIIDLFRDHRGKLQGYLRSKLGSESDAQELAQEAYLRLLRINEKQLVRHPQNYLYRIATNLAHELYAERLPAHRRLDSAKLDDVESPDPSPEQRVERSRQLQRVEAALREMPPKCRAVVTMRSRQGMTNREIAERLGLSTEMVKKYMAKGVAHCRKRLRRLRDEEQ